MLRLCSKDLDGESLNNENQDYDIRKENTRRPRLSPAADNEPDRIKMEIMHTGRVAHIREHAPERDTQTPAGSRTQSARSPA